MDCRYKGNIVDFPFSGKQLVYDVLSMMLVALRKEGITVLNKKHHEPLSYSISVYSFIDNKDRSQLLLNYIILEYMCIQNLYKK